MKWTDSESEWSSSSLAEDSARGRFLPAVRGRESSWDGVRDKWCVEGDLTRRRSWIEDRD